ncbi:MAG: diguanylate cyclase [Clostridiales bacterium]|nr:diguanylate cyclase [Candidatus Crickella caballi]
MTCKELYGLVESLKMIYQIVRVIDPRNNKVILVYKDGSFDVEDDPCYQYYGKSKRCDNCIAVKASKQHSYQEKYEFVNQSVYHISANEIDVEDKKYIVETVARVDDNVIAEAYGKGQFNDIIESVNHKLYVDPLTGVYNRRYYEDFFLTFSHEEAVAVIDVDEFKNVNDEYGHSIGDLALRAVADAIRGQVRNNDVVIRFGGDEFIIVFNSIPKDVFVNKMENIRAAVERVRIASAFELRLTISIGCSYADADRSPSFDEADKQLYLAKRIKNRVCIGEDVTELKNYVLSSTAIDSDIPSSYEELESKKSKSDFVLPEYDDFEHVMKSFVGDYHSILKVDLSTGDIRIYQDKGGDANWTIEASSKGYESYRKDFAAKFLFPEDREWFLTNTNTETLIDRLRKDDVFYLNHRVIKNGVINYYQTKLVRDLSPGGPWILIGGHSVDKETRDKELAREKEKLKQRSNDMIARLAEDYEGIYLANVDTGEMMAIRAKGIAAQYGDAELPIGEDFDNISRIFALNSIVPEDRDAFLEFMSKSNIREMSQNCEGNQVFNFRVDRNKKRIFYQVVVSWNEEDETGLWVLIGIHSINESIRMAEKLVEDEAMIIAFSSNYESLGIVNVDNDTIEVLKKGRTLGSRLEDVWVGDVLPYWSTVDDVVSHFILPEDHQQVLSMMHSDNLYRHFKSSDEPLNVAFRMENGEGVRYMDVGIAKLHEKSEKHRAILGIRDIHEITVAEMARNTALENDLLINGLMDSLNDEANPDVAIATLLNVVGNYYDGIRSYLYEIDYDNNKLIYEHEWVKDPSYSQLEEYQSVTLDDIQFWIDEVDEEGIFSFRNEGELGYRQSLSYQKLGVSDLTSIIVAGVWIGGVLSAFIGVDNCKENMDNTFPLKTAASLAYGEIIKKKEAEQQNRLNDAIIETIGEIVEARDYESGEHIHRVKDYVRIIAEDIMMNYPEYGLDEEQVNLIAKCSSLHDVGKVMISDNILLKNGKLTDEEFAEMKTHCEKGCYLIDKSTAEWDENFRLTSLQICRWHHEKYDGRGYPDGLKGDEIPISAQIVSIADCFDALLSERSYKPAYSVDKAYKMILNGECGVFNEKLIASFVRCRDQFGE